MTANPRLVTCRRAAHDTMPDQRAPHDRPYVSQSAPEPEGYVPDFRADYLQLPHFRATLKAMGWCGLATGKHAGTVPDFGLKSAA